MRLIDADELITTILTNDLCGDDNVDKAILNAPTVKAIPIDKPFLKMRYGDYVVYNKKWLVNHLQTEWNILQGKEYKPAIPVEWIIKWECGFLKPNGEHRRVIKEMLHDWEKENTLDKQVEQWEFDDDMDWQTIQRERENAKTDD